MRRANVGNPPNFTSFWFSVDLGNALMRSYSGHFRNRRYASVVLPSSQSTNQIGLAAGALPSYAIDRQDPRVMTAPFTMAALKLDADIYRFASRHVIFQVSNLAHLLVDVVRATLRRYASRTPKLSTIAQDDWVKASYAKMFAFNDKMTRSERKIWALGQYEKFVRLMHAGAEAMGIKSLFLIQPIPGWGKPLTPRETEFARNTNTKLYKEITDHMVVSGEKHGVPVYSLLDVFQDTNEEIYKDQAHINELGNEIVARRVADCSRRFGAGHAKGCSHLAPTRAHDHLDPEIC